MRRTLLMTLTVLACALSLCALSRRIVNETAGEARRLASLAVAAEREDRAQDADEALASLADFWRRREPLMETFSHHDALNDIDASLAEAAVCLEAGDRDDFLRLMVTVDRALVRLREEEALSWPNLY